MSSRFSALRRRAWPTRDAFEARLDALDGQIADLRAAVTDLAAEQRRLLVWEAETRTRVRRTQALTARTYEGIQRWPELLAAARADPDYELAYTEPDPLVSVPIPTFHAPDLLCDRALASVRAQTYSNWEAIVVGDHCTDDTEARVRALGDERIRFHNLDVREHDPEDPWERWAVKGTVPRATGVALAGGRWIAPLSHDDAWDPDHLATVLAAARERRAEVAYSRQRLVAAREPDQPVIRELGSFPPRLGEFGWQSAIFHGALRFLRYDRTCALASEPNDWNLARRAWDAGIRFHRVERATVTLFDYGRQPEIETALHEMGLPPSAAGA
jgi:hypothetical protein